MGCHTWFYAKVERTQEEAKQSCLRSLKRSRNLYWKIYKRPTSYLGINWVLDFGLNIKQYKAHLLNKIGAFNRKIRMVSNNLCQRAVWNRQDDTELTVYVDGKGLYIETEYHDLFRKYGYPNDKLFSLQETLDYIGNAENECEVFENTYKNLYAFWEKYPNGMIKFG